MIYQTFCVKEKFEKIVSGEKSFVIIEDIEPVVGDLLAINEGDLVVGKYTDRSCLVYIDYICDEERYTKPGQIICSIKPCVVHKSTAPYSPQKMAHDYSVPVIMQEIGKESRW